MKQLRIGVRVLLVLLLVLATQGSFLSAQVKSSAITGTVTDKTGAVVPNATVIVVEQETSTSTATQTTGKGEYTVPYLPIGRYTLVVNAPGFETYRKTDIILGSATTAREDVPMSVGSTTASVEVKADALALQTESATVQGAVNKDLISTLPNVNGNPLYYATLQAGVVPTTQALNSQALGVGYTDRQSMSDIRINGGELGSNDVQLDGNSIQGAAWHETAVLPNPDSLEEVRVTTNTFTADTGDAQGVISMTTKSGTNKFHGDLNFMLRNEDLNANSFSNNAQHVARPKYRLLQGGGSIGGPVIIPKLYNGTGKLFFFASFLRLTHSNPDVYLAEVPTALERQGNFSQTLVPGNNGSPVNINIYNPFTATPVAGSNGTLYQRQIYPNAIVTNPNPYGLKILQGFPLPNATPVNVYNANNYKFVGSTPETRNSFNGRVDYKLRSNQSIYVTGGISKGSILPPNQWGTAANGTWVSQTYPGNITDDNPYGAIGDTIILTPTTVLDVRYGVTHINTQAMFSQALGDPTVYGMPAGLASIAPYPGVLPELGGFGYGSLNSNNYGNKSEHQLNHAITGSVTKAIGRWTIKAGGEYRVYLGNWADIQYQTPTLSTTAVTGQLSNVSGANSTQIVNPQDQGNLAAILATGVTGWTMPAGTAPKLALAAKYVAFYSQNTWRPTTKWLLSFGLRYEIQPGPTERYNRMSSLDLNSENPFASGAQGVGNLGLLTFPGVGGYSRNLYETQWNNFSPRLGATYQVDAYTLLRGGYGRNYLPSNTGFNANGLVYGTTPFSAGANSIPFGLSPNGLPIGTFDQPQNTIVIQPAGAVQSPTNYGTTGGVDLFNRYLYKTGHVDQYNFFVERRLGPTWIFSAGYVGSRSGDLPWRQFPLNGTWSVANSTLQAWHNTWVASNGSNDPSQAQVPNPLPALIGKASGASGGATITAMQAVEPYLAFLGETNMRSGGTSNFNSLEVKGQHSVSHGLMIMGSYTWSKALGLTGGILGQSYNEFQASNGTAGPTGGVDYVNLKNNYSLLSFDTPNRFVAAASYILPFGKGQALNPGNSVVRAVIGGWQLTTAVTLQGGNPWGPTCSGTLNGRCNVVPGEPVEVAKSQQHWYNGSTTATLPDGRTITPGTNTFLKWNPDRFTQPIVKFANGNVAVDQYTNGTTPMTIGSMRTPGFENTNISVIRKFAIGERTNLDLHVNATNALNHANHYGVNNTVGSVTSTSGASGTAPGQNSNVSFGTWGLTTSEARQLTLALNMNF
jgi:trimeric autotransporter adhesin